jgi:hypothetical protein
MTSIYSRRNPWTREELIMAYDACPKRNQAYGPSAPVVREVADLIGRTPSAVSLIFGNLWSARTHGAHGLVHASKLIAAVVDHYGDDFQKLRRDALRLRGERIPRVLTPRLEVYSASDDPPVSEDDVRVAARQSGLSQSQFFVTTRPGSAVVDVGVLLEALLTVTTGWLAIATTIDLIRRLINRRGRNSRSAFTVTKSRTWAQIEQGQTRRVEQEVLQFYLPGFPVGRLASADRTRMAGYLALIRGVQRSEIPSGRPVSTDLSGATRGRPFKRKTLERLLRVSLSDVPDERLKGLSDLVKVARTAGFREALRRAQKSRRER